MQAVQNALAVVAGFIGVLTALVTLYAKYADVQKSNARDAASSAPPPPAPVFPGDAVIAPPVRPVPPPDAAGIERVRQLVRGPAIAVMTAGAIGFFANLFMAGFGYVDAFVTPLTDDSRTKQLAAESARRSGLEQGLVATFEGEANSERANSVFAMIACLGFTVPSLAAIWAGYNMMRLRSYWLSVAGSIAVMPSTFVCCLSGVPVGVWSLVILFRPEVSASFR